MFAPSKPCPFCASNNLRIEEMQVGGHKEYSVFCLNCGAAGPNDLGQSGAVEMWDLRRIPSAEQTCACIPPLADTNSMGKCEACGCARK